MALPQEVGHFGTLVGNSQHDHPLDPRVAVLLEIGPHDQAAHAVDDEIDFFDPLQRLDDLPEVARRVDDADSRAGHSNSTTVYPAFRRAGHILANVPDVRRIPCTTIMALPDMGVRFRSSLISASFARHVSSDPKAKR